MILRRSPMTRRTGNVAAMVACMLTVLLGMVGFAIDGGMLLSERRRVQSAADGAAMAAACVFYQNYPSMTDNGGNFSVNSQKTNAKLEARRVANANGYTHNASSYEDPSSSDVGKSKVRVRFPNGDDDGEGSTGFVVPTSIYNTGINTKSPSFEGNIADGCVEVTVYYFQARYFSRIWGSDVIHIVCRAVAKGAFISPEDGVIVLNYTAGQALRDTGGGTIIVNGGSFIIDSNASNATFDQGNGTIIVKGGTGAKQQSSPEFNVTGGISLGGNGTITTLNTNGTSTNATYTGIHPTPDPLAYLPEPAKPAAGTITKVGDVYTLTPGSYDGTEANFPGNLNSSESIVFNGTGIYYFDMPANNAKIKSTGGSITMSNGTDGVMLFLKQGSLDITGNSGSSMNLKGLPSGTFGGSEAYQGMVFWQPTSNTNGISITGNGGVNMSGTFYAPSTTEFKVTGNGGSGNGDTYGSQFVVNQFKVAGNGDVNINYSGQTSAKTRVLCLVE